MGMQPGADTHGLAVQLDPILHAQCQGRLGPIHWFRSAWQRGGSETGTAVWTNDDGSKTDVIVKLPVGPAELRWSTTLSAATTSAGLAAPTPQIFASGTELGGYDLCWLVAHRVPGKPVAQSLDEPSVMALLTAVADFHDAACRVQPVSGKPKSPDWETLLDKARQVAKSGEIPEGQRWNEHIHRVQRALSNIRLLWDLRSINAWCHGDVHPGNALRDTANGNGHRCTLIDLALVHPGHWVEDALYLERQFWGHEDMLHGIKPVSVLARLRRERGLSTDDHYSEIANARRVLMAACAPAVTDLEGKNAKYLHGALIMIERYLPMVIHVH